MAGAGNDPPYDTILVAGAKEKDHQLYASDFMAGAGDDRPGVWSSWLAQRIVNFMLRLS